MKKTLFSIALTALFATSCSTVNNIYQVYEVKSNDVQETNDGLVYENEDVKLIYDFCSEGGDMSFYCYNKTDKTMYISLQQSFFIRNGIAYDYYEDCDYTSTRVSSISKSAAVGASAQLVGKVRSIYQPDRWYLGSATRYTGASVTEVSGKSEAVTTHAAKTIAIPAKSAKLIPSFLVYNQHYIQCGEGQYNVNYPKKESPMVTYNESSSPLEFTNCISYTFDVNDESSYKKISNSFYLASMQNFNQSVVIKNNPDYKAFVFSKKADLCKSNSQYLFTISGASKFYNTYPLK